MVDQEEILVNIVVIVSLVLLASAFIYQTKNKNRKAQNMSIGVIIAIIAQIIYVVVMIVDQSQLHISIAKDLRDLLFGIFYFLIYLHYEALTREKPQFMVFSIVSGVLVANIAFFVLILIDPSSNFLFDIFARFNDVIGLVIWFYVSIVMLRVSRKIPERQVLVELFAVTLVFVAHIVYVLGDNYLITLTTILGDYESFADLLASSGALIIFANYLSNIDYLYRTPVPVHQILAYNNMGTPVYNEHVFIKGFQEQAVQEFLFSGIITAITSVMKESIGSKTELKKIESNQHTFLFQHTENISVVLLTSNTTQFLLNSLKMLGDLLSADIETGVLNNSGDYGESQKHIGKLIKQAFPYIIIPDMPV